MTVLDLFDDQGDQVRFVTAKEAPEHFSPVLGVTEAMVNKWHSQRKVTGYRVSRQVFFRLDELQEVEKVTRDTPQSHRRRT